MDHLQLLSPQRLARALGAFLLSFLLTFLTLLSSANAATGPVSGTCQSATCSGAEYTVCITGGNVREEAILVGDPPTLSQLGWYYVENCAPSWNRGRYTRITPLASTGCEPGGTMNSDTRQCAPPECPAGQVRNTITQQCQPPCHAAGTAGGSAYVSPYTQYPPAICRDGCKLNSGEGRTIPWSNGTTLYMVSGLVHTGEFCNGDINGDGPGNGETESYDSPSDLPPISVTPESDPPKCGPGKCPGEFNGVHMCVSCTDIASPEKPVTTYDRTTEKTTTGTPPNQTTETKTTDTKSTHDSSGTVTTTTTTSTTKTDANGNTTTEQGKTEKKESEESFCKENPTVAFCKDGKWGGGCDAFTCEGDAVQCAIAKEIHQRNCEAAKSNPYTDMTDAAQAGTDNASTYIQAQKDAAALDVNARFSQSLDASPIAASCPASRSVALPGGNSLEISFEKPCEIAGWLGHFVQAFAYLFAALIVLRNPT